MRRKLHTALPSERPARAPRPQARTGSPLPTIAALVSAFAALSVAPDAGAVIASASDASVDAADAGDAGDAGEDALQPWVPPEGERALGGVPPSTRVHGSGCGCGSEGRDTEVASALGATSMLGLALVRRRRR